MLKSCGINVINLQPNTSRIIIPDNVIEHLTPDTTFEEYGIAIVRLLDLDSIPIAGLTS